MKVLWVILTIAGMIAFGWGVSYLQNRNLVAQYGVSYEITPKASAGSQTVHFYWERNKTRLIGPTVAGDRLSVKFRYLEQTEIPDLVVRSATDNSRFAILRLNFNDPKKPSFELIENHSLEVAYPPPWQGLSQKAGR